jgi:hypothetical protein
MQFTPCAWWSKVQVETRPEPGHGAAPRLVISLAIANILLQPGREHGADGGAFFSGDYTGFLQQIRLNFQRDVGFHILPVCLCSTILCAFNTEFKPICWPIWFVGIFLYYLGGIEAFLVALGWPRCHAALVAKPDFAAGEGFRGRRIWIHL